jgi:hypothetical protein
MLFKEELKVKQSSEELALEKFKCQTRFLLCVNKLYMIGGINTDQISKHGGLKGLF